MLSPKIKVMDSALGGRGLVLADAVRAGEVLLRFEGRKISVPEANAIYDQGDDYLIQVAADAFLRLEEDTKYVNHSCAPSTAFLRANGELVALRDLPAGTEVTFDYSSNENTPFKITCACGESACRASIGPFSSLSPEQRQEIFKILAPHLKALYANE